MTDSSFAKSLMFLSALAYQSTDVAAGDYWLSDATSFQIVAVVPTATGSLVYANSVLGTALLESGAYGSLVTGAGSTVDATNLTAGATFSLSTGFSAAAANGDWGMAFAIGFAQSAAGFVTSGTGNATVVDLGSASASVTNPGPNTSIARYQADGSATYTANAAPAVSLTTAIDGQGTVSLAANVTPATNGFVLVPGTPAGTWRLAPSTSPFIGAADATTPAIYADIAGSPTVTLNLVSESVPVSASSNFDGRAALGVVGISTNGELTTTIDLSSPALSFTTTASNSSALMSLGSSLGTGVTAIDIGGDDAILATSGTSAQAIVAGLLSQQEAASLQVGLAGDRISVNTSGDASWGAVIFASSGLDQGSADLDLSGEATRISTSGQNAGGAMINANGATGSLAELRMSGAASGISTSNSGSTGAILTTTGPGASKAQAVLSGAGATIKTQGTGSAALLVSATGTRSDAVVDLSGAASAITTSGQSAGGLLAAAHGVDNAGIALRLSGAGSTVATAGGDASAALVAAIAERAKVSLALSGQGASILTSGDSSAGFTGTAIGASAAIAEAVLSGASARIGTTGASSAGLALTAIAINPDSTARAELALTGSGGGVETSGANSSAAVLTGAEARIAVGKGARLATSGTASHAALIVADSASVEIDAGGSVTTKQADSIGLFFIDTGAQNLVISHGGLATAGSAIVSAGRLLFANHGSSVSQTGAGVDLASGRIWNGGLMAGQTAVRRSGGGSGSVSIENHGRILANAGPGGRAIDLTGSFDDMLSVAPDGIIVGSIELGAGTDSFTALAGANLDFLFETEPEEVIAVTGVRVPGPDPKNLVIADPAYLTGAGAQSGLSATRLALGGGGGATVLAEVAQGDCGETVVSGRARSARDDIGGHGASTPATAYSYGVLTDYVPDNCSNGALAFFIGTGHLLIEAGGSRSRTDSVFVGGRYAGTTDGGIEYAFTSGVGYLSGESRRQVLNNRVPSGVEIAEAGYSGWTTFAGFRLSRPVMINESKLTPFLQAHAAYAGSFDVQESSILNPLAFAVGRSTGYDASAGLSVTLPPAAFGSGALQLSFSGALVVAGSQTETAVAMAGSGSGIYSDNTLRAGASFGAGLDVTFDSAPVRLHMDVLATAWNQGELSVAVSSFFKYYF
ncbi:MAG: beta strand repeat-containing protein [Hoeflea sp.]|uniref:beta strand repeat-containing protein n=1 Tax=Hoeflea sp. TaxID=1940281 RepID=UPI003EF80539